MRRTSPSASLVAAALGLAGCSQAAPSKAGPPTAAAPSPSTGGAPKARGPRAVQLALGSDHTCTLLSDGTVWCWGLGAEGQTGRGNTANIGDDETAVAAGPVDVGAKTKAIAAGDAHTCALLDTGHLRCWGRGKQGQLGYGRPDNVGDDETPASVGDVPLTDAVVAVAAGGDSTCVLLAAGSVRCWGDNQQHRLGYQYTRAQNLGDDEPVESWKPFTFQRKVEQIAMNAASTCVLFSDRAVHCWGALIGSVEDPAEAGKTPDVEIGAPVTKLSLVPISGDGCVITNDQHARCWGTLFARFTENSTVGVHSESETKTTPADFGDLPIRGAVLDIAVGSDHSCVLFRGGEVRCWGDRRFGQLGSPGDEVLINEAVAVDLGRPAAAVAVGSWHSCAITDKGAVRCWGRGKDGCLGYGSTDDVGKRSSPRVAGDVLP